MGHLLSKLFGSGDHHSNNNNNNNPQKNQQKIATNHDQAILDIKLTRDKIQKYQKQLQVCMDRELQLAQRLVSENRRDRAKICLQKRKYQEQLYERATGQLNNLQQMVQQIEFAQIESEVIHGIRQGKEALEAIQREIGSIEDVEKLMDETREAMEYQNEVSRILSENLTVEDQDGVEEELAQMMKQMQSETSTSTTTTVTAEKIGGGGETGKMEADLSQIVVPKHEPVEMARQEEQEEEVQEEEEEAEERVAVAV